MLEVSRGTKRRITSEVDGCLFTVKFAKKVADFAMLKTVKNGFSSLKDLGKREYKLPEML